MTTQNHDNSELKRAKDAMQESKENYRTFFEESKDPMYFTTQEGKFIAVNQAACDTFDYTRDEVRKINALDLYVNPADRIKFKQEIEKKRSVKDYELKLCKKDGTVLDCVITTTLWKDNDGSILGYKGITRDITEQRELERKLQDYMGNLEKLNEELKRKTVELEVLNKELEAFSYSVSHDLRAPLRSIDGFSKVLLEDSADVIDAQSKDYLQRVRAASIRMTELIEALLVLSRVTRGEMHRELVDLSFMAQIIATEIQETQPERQADFIITPGLTANGDARLLRSALENLLGNAWKFTGMHPQARIEFGSTEQEGEIVYFVRDNGVGFDKTYADKLFSAFQRLHSQDEFTGIGIGLATVKRIIHRHGGRVWAEGEVEKGATFYFTL